MTFAADMLADYREIMAEQGETVTVTRANGSTHSVKAQPLSEDIVEGVGVRQSTMRRFVIIAQDLADAGFSLPWVSNKDRITWAGRDLVVKSVDDTVRRTGGTVIAYEVTTAGQ